MIGQRGIVKAAQKPTQMVPGSGTQLSSLPTYLSSLLELRLGVQAQQQQQQQQAPAQCVPSPMATLFELDLGPQQPSMHGVGTRNLCSADRSMSDLESYRELRASCGLSEPVDQLISLCCPASDIELAVAEHLRHVRSMPCTMRGDTGDLAAELLAMGLLVQVRQGAGSSEAAPRMGRDCLRSLRHTFMVCTGYQRGGEPTLFREPLVVEPRFKEQFVIAHPTPAYTQLLQVLPVSFVGSARRLEAAVRLLADQMAVAFRSQGRSLPPWRTAEAMMSKWAPGQLSELTKLMRTTTASQQQCAAIAQVPTVCTQTPVAGLQQDFWPPPVAAPNGSQQHAVAMEVVRSMSRQMSSTGMCAHSVPETQVAFKQADSLRRSICGVQGGATPMGLFSPTGCRSSAQATVVGDPLGSDGGVSGGVPAASADRRELASPDHRSEPVTQVMLYSPGRTRSDAAATFGAAAAGLEVIINVSNGVAPGQRRVSGCGVVPAGVEAAAATVMARAPMLSPRASKSPFLGTVQISDLPAAAKEELQGALDGSRGAVAQVAAAAGLLNASPAMVQIEVSNVNGGPACNGQMAPLPPPGFSGAPMNAATAISAQILLAEDVLGALHPMDSPPASHNTLRIVRQSSSDLKQAVKHARGHTRSALAAALKAVALAPSGGLEGQQQPQQPQGPLGGSGVSVPGQGVRLGVRRVGAEEVWPPKITTVKWGAQGAGGVGGQGTVNAQAGNRLVQL